MYRNVYKQKRCEKSIKGLYRQILEEEGVNLEQDLEKLIYIICI